MQVSQNGIDLIKHFEGLRLTSYQDVAGHWTIGYGHTGITVGINQTISEREANTLLRDDVKYFSDGVQILLGELDIHQYMFDALVSLAYNIGLGNFKRSSALALTLEGKYEGAADAITLWNKATVGNIKRIISGLVRRRSAERDHYLAGIRELEIRPFIVKHPFSIPYFLLNFQKEGYVKQPGGASVPIGQIWHIKQGELFDGMVP